MENELLRYLIGHGQQFMLPAESQALRQLGLSEEGKATYTKMAYSKHFHDDLFGFNNPDALALVALGREEAEKKIARRIYNDHHKQIINLCPSCNRLARTPTAKQCRHCGHDWH